MENEHSHGLTQRHKKPPSWEPIWQNRKPFQSARKAACKIVCCCYWAVYGLSWRNFRSAAAITRVLLECMNKTAPFNNLENAKLREFADLCTDMESQMSYLPGLACLIFPNAIQLIPERLPLFLCQKWEKEISKHTECLAFHAKSLDEGTEWLLTAGLCYCCLSKGHMASDCKENIECSICKDKVMQLSFTEREQGPLPKVEKPLTQNADRCVML